MQKKRVELKKSLKLLTLTIIIFIILLESISFLTLNNSKDYFNEEKDTIMSNYNHFDKDDYMGYTLKKNFQNIVSKSYLNGSIIYNVTYLTDKYRRRTINEEYDNNNPHIILFGGSYAFGEGLNDDETLQYYLDKNMRDYNIYNYAFSGYGPQHMLALLEKRNLSKEVHSNSGIAIYVFLPFHIKRTIGSSYSRWIYDSPYYLLDEDNILAKSGSFNSDRKVISAIYMIYGIIKERSNFLRLINLEFPLITTDYHITLNKEILKKSKMLYEKQFNGTLYLLVHPLNSYTRSKQSTKLLEELRKEGLIILDYNISDRNEYKISIPGDYHPNGELNKILSKKLSDDLKKRYKT